MKFGTGVDITYKVHNILQSSFLHAQLGLETFDFIQKIVALPGQKFFTHFTFPLLYGFHGRVGCIFDEINMYSVRGERGNEDDEL
jgi:hypothetical protein